MSYRRQQVESTLKRAISHVLTREMSDPRIEGMVSITRVSVSPDLRDAQVYVSIIPAEKQGKTLGGLRHASRYIHGLVSKQVVMKTVPRLTFRLDESLKKQAEIFKAIQRGLAGEDGDVAHSSPDSAESSSPPQADSPRSPDDASVADQDMPPTSDRSSSEEPKS